MNRFGNIGNGSGAGRITSKRAVAVPGALVGALVGLGGCYLPGGSLVPATGQAETYHSLQTRPVTVRLVDLRSHEVIFEMDVPAGMQFTYDFLPDQGDDPVRTPDLMRYQVWPIGTTTGSLKSSLTVPSWDARRIDVYFTQEIRERLPEPDRQLRTDELEDRPDWWTPRGGEMPAENPAVTNYDG